MKRCCEAGQRRRSRLAGGAGRQGEAGAAGLHRLHLGHDRASQGRARHPRQASGRHALGGGAVSDADGEAAPHGRLPAAVPCAGPRYRRDPAADDGPRAAHRRNGGGPAGDAVRNGADGAVHRAALPAEDGGAGAGAGRQHLGASSGSPTIAPSRLRGRTSSAAGRARRRHCPSLQHALWRAAVFRPILNKIGFDKLELVVSGGAPLPAETMAVWHMLGVNVCEMYGQTETAGGIIAGQRGPFPRPGDVGTVPEGFEVEAGGRRRDPGALAGSVRRLLEQPGGLAGGARARRLDAHRRCRRMARRQAAPDRPGARLPRHVGRQDHLAVVHRERPAGQPLSRRGGRVRPRPQISDRADRDRFRDGGRLGAQHTTWPIPASPAWRSIRACAA